MNTQSAGRTLALAILLATAAGAAAGEDDRDPGNGQSWLTRASVHEAHDGGFLAGTLRATDDYGATRERDFRLKVSGSIGREDREAVLNRFEPECFELARAARLTLEDYCDQITMTWRDGDAHIAFSSLDANRRYAFTLRADPGSPNEWASLDPGVPAPSLRLAVSEGGNGITYRWALRAEDATYNQAGEVTGEQLRGIELHPLEASLAGLSDVLMTFNRYAFERAILPREDPDYRPTPYNGWAEEAVEGGCIFDFCFGNLGGGGPGAGNNNNACKPDGAAYNTNLCPYDITYATWPIAARPKLQKLSNDKVRFLIFAKNVGSGQAFIPQTGTTFTVTGVHASLVRLGSEVPLAPFGSSDPYGVGQCYRKAYNGLNFLMPLSYAMVELDAGEFQSMSLTEMECPASSGRPAGRYRLHINIDPQFALDYPGNSGNNIGTSGVLEWVNLRN